MKLVIAKAELIATKNLHNVVCEALGDFKSEISLLKQMEIGFNRLLGEPTIIVDEPIIKISIESNGDLTFDVNQEFSIDLYGLYGEYLVSIASPLQALLMAAKQLIMSANNFGKTEVIENFNLKWK